MSGIEVMEHMEEERAWLALINQSWARGWSDPREDVYTLEDGEPSHPTGQEESN